MASHNSQKSREYFIGYDLGTSGVKTAIIDSTGNLIQSEFESYKSLSPNPGWHEQDPKEWWAAIMRTTRKAVKKSGISTGKILGLSFGVQAHGMLPVGKKGDALQPCMTWLDSRSTIQAKKINKALRIALSSKDFPSKALWLREKKPKIFDKTHKLLDCQAYLISRFTGDFVWSDEIARWCGYDIDRGVWKYDKVGLPSYLLPRIATMTEVVGEVNRKAAEETGLKQGIPVVAGGSDFTAAVVGSGAIRQGRAHIYLGTSSWIGVISESVIAKTGSIMPTTFSTRFADRWVIGGEMESACACLNWFKDELARDVQEKSKIMRVNPYRMLDQMAERVRPSSENLIFLPWMKGERAPITDDYARGSFIGLTLTHRREHLIRAIMEGVAYNLQWIMDQIEHESRVRVSSLRAIGGGFQSKIWAQIISDIMRKKIEVVKWPQQAGAIGAALIAALGVGVFKKFDDLDRLSPVIFTATPKKEHRRTYTRMSSDYRRIYTEEMAAMYRRWGIP